MIAKGGTITRKGKVKRGPSNKKSQAEKAEANERMKSVYKEEMEREEKRRADNDFTNADGLGDLDMDAFFEKAAAGLQDEDDGSSDEESVDSGAEKDDGDEDGDGDDDSYASLGSEEEDIEASEARMKKELEKLSETDPEFHKYLKDNESSLLEYGDDDDEMDEDGEEDEYIQDEDAMDEFLSDDDNDDMKAEVSDESIKKQFEKQQRLQENKFLLTPQRLEQVEQSAFEYHSIKGLKRIISAFRTASHLSDANRKDEEVDSDDEEAMRSRKKEFQITSPVVFDRLMSVCLVNCHEEFYYHLLEKQSEDDSDDESSASGSEDDEKKEAFDESKPINPSKLSKSPHWSKVGPSMESFFKSTLHLLSEAGKDANLLKFVLTALSKYVPYLTAFPKITKKLLKTCVKIWSAPLDTSEDYNAVRLQAFLRIRQMAITQPYPLIEDCLKMTYLSYAQRSKFGTASNVTSVLPTLTFMGNCIVELYTLDYASAYQHAFIYIRQLALHLRTALMKHTPESMAAVYCWQYIHCLKLWVAVLSASQKKNVSLEDSNSKLGGGAGKDEEANLLRSLVYPLTEIILGVCRLIPTTRYVPLRLHCVRLLQQLAASTESFIPTTSLLLGVLESKEISMKPLRQGGGKKKKKKEDVRGLRLPLILKLPKEGTLRTMEQLDAVLKETFALLNREVDLYRYSPGFPEFAFTILHRL